MITVYKYQIKGMGHLANENTVFRYSAGKDAWRDAKMNLVYELTASFVVIPGRML